MIVLRETDMQLTAPKTSTYITSIHIFWGIKEGALT